MQILGTDYTHIKAENPTIILSGERGTITGYLSEDKRNMFLMDSLGNLIDLQIIEVGGIIYFGSNIEERLGKIVGIPSGHKGIINTNGKERQYNNFSGFLFPTKLKSVNTAFSQLKTNINSNKVSSDTLRALNLVLNAKPFTGKILRVPKKEEKNS